MRATAKTSPARKFVFAAVLSCSICLSACKGDQKTTWSAEVKSSDGQWIADALSQQWSGPGNAYDATTVSLKRADASQKPIEILGFSHQYATMNLQMNWLDNTHLQIDYGPSTRPADAVDLYFQVVKCCGLNISLRDISNSSH